MPSQRYGHVLTLKITPEMRSQIDNALTGMKSVLQTRCDFIRAAVGFALDNLSDETPEDVIIDEDQERLLTRDLEPDTTILSTAYRRVDGVPVLVERWSFEGVHGSTAIFLTHYASAMDDAALHSFLKARAGLELGETVTITRRDTHTFVNYGFQAV